MRIGEIIKTYRDEHGESQRSMAKKLNVSHAYIAMLEKGINNRTGKEPAPSIYFFADVARLLGISIDKLFQIIDNDQPIIIPPSRAYNQSNERLELLRLAENLPKDKLGEAINYLTFLSQKQSHNAKGA